GLPDAAAGRGWPGSDRRGGRLPRPLSHAARSGLLAGRHARAFGGAVSGGADRVRGIAAVCRGVGLPLFRRGGRRRGGYGGGGGERTWPLIPPGRWRRPF